MTGKARKYTDERGWIYFVQAGIGHDVFKTFYQKPGKNPHAWRPVVWQKTFEAAQNDLDREAAKRNWTSINGNNYTKQQIANELLKNSSGVIKNQLMNYIANMNLIGEEEFDIYDCLMCMDRCVAYIQSEGLDITNWFIFEIPIDEVYVFVNNQTNQIFDLVIQGGGKVIPCYLDSEATQRKANSIQEAINNYVVYIEKE